MPVQQIAKNPFATDDERVKFEVATNEESTAKDITSTPVTRKPSLKSFFSKNYDRCALNKEEKTFLCSNDNLKNDDDEDDSECILNDPQIDGR